MMNDVDVADVERAGILNVDCVVERQVEVEELECVDVLDVECVDERPMEVHPMWVE